MIVVHQVNDDRQPPAGQRCRYWSRRVDEEHRLVCHVDGEDVVIIQARTYYGK